MEDPRTPSRARPCRHNPDGPPKKTRYVDHSHRRRRTSAPAALPTTACTRENHDPGAGGRYPHSRCSKAASKPRNQRRTHRTASAASSTSQRTHAFRAAAFGSAGPTPSAVSTAPNVASRYAHRSSGNTACVTRHTGQIARRISIHTQHTRRPYQPWPRRSAPPQPSPGQAIAGSADTFARSKTDPYSWIPTPASVTMDPSWGPVGILRLAGGLVLAGAPLSPEPRSGSHTPPMMNLFGIARSREIGATRLRGMGGLYSGMNASPGKGNAFPLMA